MAIPKGFRHELRELTGFRSIRGIATASYACLAMTEMFYAAPSNGVLNYNLYSYFDRISVLMTTGMAGPMGWPTSR